MLNWYLVVSLVRIFCVRAMVQVGLSQPMDGKAFGRRGSVRSFGFSIYMLGSAIMGSSRPTSRGSPSWHVVGTLQSWYRFWLTTNGHKMGPQDTDSGLDP